MVKVCVSLITYNQEKYIEKAIKSVLMQKTNFDFELVIGNDCSTDKTTEIVNKYAQIYPKIIRVLKRKHNLGMIPNFIDTIKSCKGKYIALLEGDDYWNSPNKIQEQSDFLDSKQNCTICFTQTSIINDEGILMKSLIPSSKYNKEVYSLSDILKENFIATCSAMYRNKTVNIIPSWISNMGMGDWPMHIFYALKGDIGFIKRKMAVYRIHKKSNFSSRPKFRNYIDIVKLYDQLFNFLTPNYSLIFEQIYGNYVVIILRELWKQKEYKDWLVYYNKLTKHNISNISLLNKLKYFTVNNLIRQ